MVCRKKSNIGRLTRGAKTSRKRRAAETAEEREIRLERERQNSRKRMANQTPEEKELRMSLNRKRRRAYQEALRKVDKQRVRRLIQERAENVEHKTADAVVDNQQNEIYLVENLCKQTMFEGETNTIYNSNVYPHNTQEHPKKLLKTNSKDKLDEVTPKIKLEFVEVKAEIE